jgi:hypothetical protein
MSWRTVFSRQSAPTEASNRSYTEIDEPKRDVPIARR